MVDQRKNRELQRHTHAQYVALRNNEDRLLGERFIAQIFASSFLAVVWATGDFGLGGRVSVAAIGLIITVGMWWITLRAARAAGDWRRLAISEERAIYNWYFHRTELSQGPYGLREALDRSSSGSNPRRIFYRLIFFFGLLEKLGLGRTNIMSAFWIPLFLAAWWIFAIIYAFLGDWRSLTHM